MKRLWEMLSEGGESGAPTRRSKEKKRRQEWNKTETKLNRTAPQVCRLIQRSAAVLRLVTPRLHIMNMEEKANLKTQLNTILAKKIELE